MIDSVYRLVQTLTNKANFGYISPMDFNLMSENAQLDIYQTYFADYNRQVNLENVRRSGTDYADISKQIVECIETFSVTNFLSNSSNNTFFYPSLTTTGDTAYMMGKILTYTEQLATGSNTSVSANNLVATAGAFSATTIKANDIVINTTTNLVARVVAVTNATTISLSANIFLAFPNTYKIISARSPREADKISHGKSTLLNTSLNTAPSNTFPAYTLEGNLVTLFPSTINVKGMVQAQYFRYPAAPKWTYVSLAGGAPSFDQSAVDYQDFELPESEIPNLVSKICKMAGLEIREAEVVQYAQQQEMQDNQPKV